MAISISKKKSRLSKKVETTQHSCFYNTCLFKLLNRIPLAFFLLLLIFIWSSSTTIISGNIFHVCVSSRKLNNLYCFSAGSQPNLELPIPTINNGSISTQSTNTYEDMRKDQITIPMVNNVMSSTPSATEDTKRNQIVEVVRDDSAEVLIRNKANQSREEEIANAEKIVEGQLRLHRSWTSDHKNQAKGSCEGNGIYVYDLPSKFNKDLVGQCRDMVPWKDFCNYFSNEALGEPITKLGNGWYQTHQYSLEPIFHAKVLKHACRVYNEKEAKLFYVPFYGGLDILRWHFKNVSNDVKDTLALDLLSWLDKQNPWSRNSGKDHVFVLGKISWDFRRKTGSWGTRFLELDQMQNPIKLLIERQPWQVNDIGIPHPTYFHPHSDDDIISWQLRIITSERKHLVSFAGAARPESVIELFVESEFCLQPPGDSPTRKSVFDSLISGCIPVVFDPFTAYYQYPWHLPEDNAKYSLFIDQEEVRQMKTNVVERLMKVSKKERDDMRRFIVYELLPGLVYGDSNSILEKFQDGFAITMSNLLERVNKMESQ